MGTLVKMYMVVPWQYMTIGAWMTLLGGSCTVLSLSTTYFSHSPKNRINNRTNYWPKTYHSKNVKKKSKTFYPRKLSGWYDSFWWSPDCCHGHQQPMPLDWTLVDDVTPVNEQNIMQLCKKNLVNPVVHFYTTNTLYWYMCNRMSCNFGPSRFWWSKIERLCMCIRFWVSECIRELEESSERAWERERERERKGERRGRGGGHYDQKQKFSPPIRKEWHFLQT